MSDSDAVDWYCKNTPRYSNVTWGTGFTYPAPSGNKVTPTGQTNGWDNARQYYYNALTTTDTYSNSSGTSKDNLFALTFRSLGMILHLLQDMAVPAHVRNDMTSHLYGKLFGADTLFKRTTNPFEKYVQSNFNALSNAPTIPVFSSPAKPTDFWDTNIYSGINPEITRYAGIGLSEYTNANFLSDFTIFDQNPTAAHYFPYPSSNSVSTGTKQIANPFMPGTIIPRQYYIKTSDGEAGYLLAGVGYLDVKVPGILPNTTKKIPPMDNNVHSDYAQLLLPRAVGYSAALLDYFFRGTLEISPPDQQVYAITDGSKIPQQFTTIKAKIKNTTPNEAILAGSLVAVARYKIDTNYSSDLSTALVHNPATTFAYSVSAPVAIQLNMNLAPIEYTFDFSNSKIPAGITDLTLQVVFQGTLGNEANNAVAIGMKDLSEPTHHVIWNLTDMFSLDYQLKTAQQIRIDPTLAARAGTAQIDPYDITFTIGYTGDPNSAFFSPDVAHAMLPYGRHMRLIGIFDIEKPNFMELGWSGVSGDSYSIRAIQPVKNQDYGTTWFSEPAATPFRNWLDTDGVTKRPFLQHYNTGVLSCKPMSYDAAGKPFCSYPVEQAYPAAKTPITATIE